MPRLPIVLVHGYSDQGASFGLWRDRLVSAGYQATEVHIGNYISLSDEVSIRDIAEGFDRALRIEAGLEEGEPFDAIVHSTGMLVVREWLTAYEHRQGRLKHLIGLAPATFGSPMAHKGRSWLGAVFKGGKQPGPDFMEAGDQVLRGLELGSSYTWDLAHKDFLGADAVYGPTRSTPFPFIFVGLKDYGWIKRAVTEPGTDGTVRWAGVGFNVRKVTMDLTRQATDANRDRIVVEPWANTEVPLTFVPDANHGTILSSPSDTLVGLVTAALAVNSTRTYADWKQKFGWDGRSRAGAKADRWQQFVIRAVDERGDGIADYFVELGRVAAGTFKPLQGFDVDVHAFKDDHSYRCFHVNLDDLPADLSAMGMRIIAESGTERVGYQGFSSPNIKVPKREAGKWDAVIQFDEQLEARMHFFYPYTTTLLEIRMNREPMPIVGPNEIFQFVRA